MAAPAMFQMRMVTVLEFAWEIVAIWGTEVSKTVAVTVAGPVNG
jgi:hypothetical protein